MPPLKSSRFESQFASFHDMSMSGTHRIESSFKIIIFPENMNHFTASAESRIFHFKIRNQFITV